METFPRISVIIPSFNQGVFIEKTLKSILLQKYPALELIIADGASTDQTVEIIKRHAPSITWWVSEKDRGQSHAFNKGLEHATGDIIGWLNSDDLYLGRCLFEGADYFERHPSCDMVFADYIYIDAEGNYLNRRREPPFDAATYVWTEDCYHANCAGFFRKRVFDRLGGLSEEFHYGMDYEFYLRAWKAGLQFGQVHSYWGAYRLHNLSKSVSAFSRQQEDGRAIFSRFRAPSTRAGFATRRLFYKYRRIAQKALLGNYLPGWNPARYYQPGDFA